MALTLPFPVGAGHMWTYRASCMLRVTHLSRRTSRMRSSPSRAADGAMDLERGEGVQVIAGHRIRGVERLCFGIDSSGYAPLFKKDSGFLNVIGCLSNIVYCQRIRNRLFPDRCFCTAPYLRHCRSTVRTRHVHLPGSTAAVPAWIRKEAHHLSPPGSARRSAGCRPPVRRLVTQACRYAGRCSEQNLLGLRFRQPRGYGRRFRQERRLCRSAPFHGFRVCRVRQHHRTSFHPGATRSRGCSG
jgi:hypothetical protein